MTKEKNIKSINSNYLIGYMLMNYLVFVWLSSLFVLNLGDLAYLYKWSVPEGKIYKTCASGTITIKCPFKNEEEVEVIESK